MKVYIPSTDSAILKLEVLTRRHIMLQSVKVKLLRRLFLYNGLLCFV